MEFFHVIEVRRIHAQIILIGWKTFQTNCFVFRTLEINANWLLYAILNVSHFVN